MDFSEILTRKILYPLVEWKNGTNTLKYLREHERMQYLSREEILNVQLKRLQALLEYAYEFSPYYTEQFKRLGMVPSDIRTTQDYLKFPILSKEDIQLKYPEMLSSVIPVEDMIEDYTGGSTGKPLKFYYEKKRSERREASRIRHNKWTGWDIGRKMAVLWGAPSDIQSLYTIKGRLKNCLLDKIVFLDSFDLTAQKMNEFKVSLEKFKPAVILAYANSIYLFAKFLQDKPHEISPSGIICSAETLTEDKRKLIESVFNCKVFNRYGSREVGLIASECEEHSGLHINADNIYVEILRNNRLAGDGEMGEVVVTDLFNYAMPMIRYKIGDVAMASSDVCPCGRGFPLIGNVEGRVSDFIVLANKKMIHGEYFTHLFYGEEGVHEIQIVQTRENHIVLMIVPSDKYSEQRIINIKQQINNYIGNDIEIELKIVKEIPKTSSGKYRFTISEVPLNF